MKFFILELIIETKDLTDFTTEQMMEIRNDLAGRLSGYNTPPREYGRYY